MLLDDDMIKGQHKCLNQKLHPPVDFLRQVHLDLSKKIKMDKVKSQQTAVNLEGRIKKAHQEARQIS